jgi:hypothetical protein
MFCTPASQLCVTQAMDSEHRVCLPEVLVMFLNEEWQKSMIYFCVCLCFGWHAKKDPSNYRQVWNKVWPAIVQSLEGF